MERPTDEELNEGTVPKYSHYIIEDLKNGHNKKKCSEYIIIQTIVIKQSLKGSPMWNSLVSTIETEVIKLFEDKNVINISKKKPEQPETVKLINMLISEYMDWMGYKCTNAMFMKELGCELKTNNCRKEITTQLNLEDNNETLHMPLLTVLITMFKNKNGNTEALDD